MSSSSTYSSESTSSSSSSYIENWTSSSFSSNSSSSSSYFENWSSSSTESSSSSSSSYIENWSSSSYSSSSSSSSSYLDYEDDKTKPFYFEREEANPIWCMDFYKGDVYAGTGSRGELIKSSDRFFWGKVYTVDDVNIKSLLVKDDKLYIGTSPLGKIYIMDLLTGTTSLSVELSGEIVGFLAFKNNIYAARSNPSGIYRYNNITLNWDLWYKPYTPYIYKMLSINDVSMLIFTNETTFTSDGQFMNIFETGNSLAEEDFESSSSESVT